MNPKSSILVQLEIIEAVQRLKEYTEILLESYRIDDIVLGIVNGQPQEVVDGYLSEMKEYDTLEKAMREFNPNKNCIRILEGKYFVGNWSKNPVQSDGKVLSISNFREI
jgi:hypothetical protein